MLISLIFEIETNKTILDLEFKNKKITKLL